MATPNIVPRAAGEGGLGAAAKGWGGAFITNTTTSSATEGGKIVLAADDGAVMADDHRLGVIEFKGAEDTSNTLTNGARIQCIADAAWSASENGASLEFYTTDGNASESVALTLDSNNLATFAGKIAGPIEIEQGSTGGGDCLHIDNDDRDQISLKINSENTTVPILDIESAYLSTGTGINVNLDGLTTGRGINLDIDDNLTTSADRTLINLDYDSFGICASGQTIGTTGLNISLEDSVTNVGTVNHTGIDIGLDFDNAGGTLTQKGIVMAVGADGVGDTASGIEMEVLDGGTDIKMMSSADTADYCSITTTANGATTITTVDGGAAAANFEVAADGNITLDAAGDIALECGGGDLTCDGLITTTHASGVIIKDSTTSSATEGGNLVLAADDGAVMGSGHRLGVIEFKGAEDTGNTLTTGARIEALCDAAWSASENGADLVFYTTDGNATQSEVMRATASTGVSIPKRKIAVTSNTDGDCQGDVVYFGGTTSMTTGAIYHYKSDGTWELADADAVATSDGLLGVALGAASDTNGMCLRGMVTIDHDPGAIGDVLFLSTTAGDCSATAPSGSADIVRVIGYQVSHASDGNIWFNPDNTYVELA